MDDSSINQNQNLPQPDSKLPHSPPGVPFLSLTISAVAIVGYILIAQSMNLWPFSFDQAPIILSWQHKSMAPTLTSQIDTSSWKMYKNTDAGIELKYLTKWNFKNYSPTSGPSVIFFEGPANQFDPLSALIVNTPSKLSKETYPGEGIEKFASPNKFVCTFYDGTTAECVSSLRQSVSFEIASTKDTLTQNEDILKAIILTFKFTK